MKMTLTKMGGGGGECLNESVDTILEKTLLKDMERLSAAILFLN